MVDARHEPHPEDRVTTHLERLDNGRWERVGTPLRTSIGVGAPFTFGRALGLDSEEIEHGSQLYLDGVAVFDRALTEQELESLSLLEHEIP